MDPVRLKGLTPDEFERLCLELAARALASNNVVRRGGLSDPDQGIDIEVSVPSGRIGIQCKSGKLSVPLLRDNLLQLVRYPKSLDRFILMCALHPMPAALDEFLQWSSGAKTVAGLIRNVEIWDPDRISKELDSHPEVWHRVVQEPRSTVFAVPRQRSQAFSGRREVMAQIDTWIRKRDPRESALLITGMAGTGKTSLVVEYAHSRRSLFPGGIFWINGRDGLLGQCARYGLLLGAASDQHDNVGAARRFLEKIRSTHGVLIIIDDLDRPNAINQPLAGGLSLAVTQCPLLVTSRFVSLAAEGAARLKLDTLSEREATELLLQVSQRQPGEGQQVLEYNAARELCLTLGLLPLAIHIAGSYLALHPTTTIQKYHETVKLRGAALSIDESEARSLHLADPLHGSLAVSLRLAYDSMRDDRAKRLFLMLSLLPEDQPVHQEMLSLLFAGHDGVAQQEIGKALAWLSNSGLVRVDDKGGIRVHTLARSFGRSLMSSEERTKISETIGNEVRQVLTKLLAPTAHPPFEVQRSPKVFLCYAGRDRGQVENLYQNLLGDGFSPWMDKKCLLPGQDWKFEIKRAIESADYFVACISRQFQDRTYGHSEIRLALEVLETMPEGSIFLIPARLEDCPVEDRLGARHWVDLFLPDGYKLLVRALRAREGRPADIQAV